MNTQENSHIYANGSQTTFAIANLFSNGTMGSGTSLKIQDVSINGMRCSPADENICSRPSCSSLQATRRLELDDRIPACLSLFCCGNKLRKQAKEETQTQCDGLSPGNQTNSGNPDTNSNEGKKSPGEQQTHRCSQLFVEILH